MILNTGKSVCCAVRDSGKAGREVAMETQAFGNIFLTNSLAEIAEELEV